MRLNRKKIIWGIFVGFILFLIAGYFLILSNKEQEEIIDSTRNLFPFGEINSGDGQPGFGSQGTIGGNINGNQETNENTGEEGNIPAGLRLRKISDFPTGGFTPIIRIEEKEVADITIDDEGNSIQSTRMVEVKNQFVRYSKIEDASVYETKVSPNMLEEEIIVDNFIPNAEIVHFNNDGNKILFQYWNNEQRTPESYLATIEKIPLIIPACPFNFAPINIDMDESRVIGIHSFLNRNPQTQISRTGINSPGNESSRVTESTITAIKNFQSLYQLDIDGELGVATREKMLELCTLEEDRFARAEFEKLERKHTISGIFLAQGISSATISPEGNQLFYIQQDADGVIGVIHNLISDVKETVFNSPFSQWLTFWNNEASIELTTKPSYLVDGFSYQLDPSTQRYFKSLQESKGLTTLASPDNRDLLIMEIVDATTRLSIHSRNTNRTRPLTIQSLVEKCTWTASSEYIYCTVPNTMAYGNEYPDVWYQGIESFSDSLWRINVQTFEEEVISDFMSEFDVDIDVEYQRIDPEEEYLYFIDKKTEELWSYRLN
jgi:hypothetical protein